MLSNKDIASLVNVHKKTGYEERTR